jgi:glycosyltransferase involved in cell wall biosynthesis
MVDTKIHILFEIKEGPWGGGNQFLRSLKKHLQSIHVYDENIATAEVVLFNSHQCAKEAAKVKLSYPKKCFIHRIDGPMRLYSLRNDERDDIVFIANKCLADATIFQSAWSQEQNHRLGLHQNSFETVIPNAPEPSIFNRQGKTSFSKDHKIRLIATSWSPNWKKGFQVYQWLDANFDFNKYEMVFVGKSPVKFKNIEHISPLSSKNIAEKLKENDIFIFASPIEACSNSLLEALHCGLPVVGIDGSSNPKLIGKGGEIFTCCDEIPNLLEKIAKNYNKYQANICNPSMKEVGEQYYDFMTQVHHQVQSGRQKRKSFRWMDYIMVQTTIYRCRLSTRIHSIVEKFKAAMGSKG